MFVAPENSPGSEEAPNSKNPIALNYFPMNPDNIALLPALIVDFQQEFARQKFVVADEYSGQHAGKPERRVEDRK
ncbi:hypothetical protein K0M31_015891, partial [Melipona bicolor]